MAAIFPGLSGDALTTRKDFSYMGGFLTVGVLVAFVAGLAAVFFQTPALSARSQGCASNFQAG